MKKSLVSLGLIMMLVLVGCGSDDPTSDYEDVRGRPADIVDPTDTDESDNGYQDIISGPADIVDPTDTEE